jgi:hypothetical protein
MKAAFPSHSQLPDLMMCKVKNGDPLGSLVIFIDVAQFRPNSNLAPSSSSDSARRSNLASHPALTSAPPATSESSPAAADEMSPMKAAKFESLNLAVHGIPGVP